MQPAATGAKERPQGDRRLLRIAEVAERLQVPCATVYRLVYDGRLPALQLRGKGSTIRIDEAQLEAWLYDQGEGV